MSSPTEKVLSYLTSQNRPYSVNDIFLNLHKEVGKSAVQKALDLLVADEKVREKVNSWFRNIYGSNCPTLPEDNSAKCINLV